MSLDKPNWNFEQLGLSYLKTVLEKENYNVKVINATADNLNDEQIIDYISDLKPDLCGFSPTCLTIKNSIYISNKIREILPNLHVVFGGHHATLTASYILLNHFSIDSVIPGYGEESIIDLVKVLDNNFPLENVTGLIYRTNSGKLKSNVHPRKNYYFKYIYPRRDIEAMNNKGFGIYTTRGCNNRCSFCTTPNFLKTQGLKGIYYREAVTIINEIINIYTNTNNNPDIEISILDDNFVTNDTFSKIRLANIANGLIYNKVKATFWFMCRPDTFQNTKGDIKLLNLIKKAGFIKIMIGIESIDNNSLKLFSKSLNEDANIDKINFLNSFGFIIHVTMILFQPYSQLSSIKKNIEFINYLMKYPNICVISSYCSRLLAMPGTTIHKKLIKEKMQSSHELLYLDPYAYKFKIKAVEKVANYMKSVEKYIAPFIWLSTDIRNFIGKRYNQGISIEKQKIFHIQDKIIQTDNLIYNHLYQIINIFQNKSDTENISLLNEKFILELNESINILKGQFKNLDVDYSTATIALNEIRLNTINL